MKLEFVPLLQVQRDLYDIPRGWTRFNSYLEALTGGTDDMVLPLSAMNPMGKAHVAERLERLLALGAEQIAQRAVSDAQRRLAHLLGELRVALVITDDLKGQWTNRYFTEASHRFQNKAEVRRQWAVGLLWTSEEPTAAKVRQTVLGSIYRTLYLERHGQPKTLRQMMRQEGLTAFFAEVPPFLDAEELAYSREVIAPYLETENFATIFGCLYGDEAAKSVGYEPIGLSERAGYGLALELARERGVKAEEEINN